MEDKTQTMVRLIQAYCFLSNYGFQEKFHDLNYGYLGKGFCLGLENDVMHWMFWKETEFFHIEILVGTLKALFGNPYDANWFRLASLIEFWSGKKIYSRAEYDALDMMRFQAILAQRIEPWMPNVVEAFKKENIQSWLEGYFEFVRRKQVK